MRGDIKKTMIALDTLYPNINSCEPLSNDIFPYSGIFIVVYNDGNCNIVQYDETLKIDDNNGIGTVTSILLENCIPVDEDVFIDALESNHELDMLKEEYNRLKEQFNIMTDNYHVKPNNESITLTSRQLFTLIKGLTE